MGSGFSFQPSMEKDFQAILSRYGDSGWSGIIGLSLGGYARATHADPQVRA